ncbi:MAG: large conductance mechanosensitive channel protein MscL [Fimbriimonadaceae bacterium]|nr:large conductance mechanosensitive channel protein MscL [Fimbriimonadaceae bacterium]
MGLVKEFKEFAVKGSVIDLAVGVIIGAAFGKIVDSLVKDVVMPPIGLVLGKVDFNNLYVLLSTEKGSNFASLADAQKAGAPVLAYGAFINNLISFLILAFVVFLMVKAVNAAKRTEPEPVADPAPTPTEELLTEIRDLLKTK